ncbi:hypothetical protein M406DRAFT_68777 [Cryphonectria parasitica EP155]|uniref:Uncharacterized protein n=1 Tax=Cryphonectria parasitica (strain ATCC 38755 / EP155) TaxID=660469 RepID=A0A9P4Y4B3_CRYP1|nr:uncharacterized protein M406DRAFT_68777 [Cryphonectria parasitica EP155]KAF3766438.1 hypothetical protein M406DRAFT_68777 [Cryphonectria parasitica EP155]
MPFLPHKHAHSCKNQESTPVHVFLLLLLHILPSQPPFAQAVRFQDPKLSQPTATAPYETRQDTIIIPLTTAVASSSSSSPRTLKPQPPIGIHNPTMQDPSIVHPSQPAPTKPSLRCRQLVPSTIPMTTM